MSTINRDFLGPARAKQAGANATYQLFKGVWGTHMEGSVEVYNSSLTYWNGSVRSDKAFKRFINKIGLEYAELESQSYDGLRSAYFKLDASKYSYEPMDQAAIAADLGEKFSVGDEFEVSVTYGGDLKRYVTSHWIADGVGGYDVDTAAIRAMLDSDKIKYYANASTEASGVPFQETDTNIYDINVGTNSTSSTTPVTKIEFNNLYITIDTIVTTTTTTTVDTITTVVHKDITTTTTDRNGTDDPDGIFDETVVVTATNETTVVDNTAGNPVGVTVVVDPVVTDIQDRTVYDALALLDDGTTFEQQGDVYSEKVTAVETTDQYGNTMVIGEYSYIIKYKVISDVLVSSYIVDECSTIAHSLYDSLYNATSSVYSITNSAPDTLIKEAVYMMNNGATSAAFYNGYLRVDYAAGIKRKDFVDILAKCFGTGYVKKKTKWYQKVIAIVIIIIAIVIIVLTWWTGVGNVAGGSMAALGLGLLYGSAFLTISMMLYAAAFPYATDGITMIGDFAQIVGYAAMVVGVYNLVISSWQAYATQAGAEAGANAAQSAYASGTTSSETLMEVYNEANATAIANFTFGDFMGAMTQDLVSTISSSATGALDSVSNVSMDSVLTDLQSTSVGDISGWMKNLNKAMDLYNQFFVTPYQMPVTESSSSEDGVETYYAAISMLDQNDMLDRMSMYKDDMFGGQQTENYLSNI